MTVSSQETGRAAPPTRSLTPSPPRALLPFHLPPRQIKNKGGGGGPDFGGRGFGGPGFGGRGFGGPGFGGRGFGIDVETGGLYVEAGPAAGNLDADDDERVALLPALREGAPCSSSFIPHIASLTQVSSQETGRTAPPTRH